MSRHRVLISAPYFVPILGRYRSLFESVGIEIIVAEVAERLSEEELVRYAGTIDGTICGDDGYTARVLEAAAPRLKVISKWGTGTDSIDRETAGRLGILVANTPGAFTEAVADTVMGYVLAFARRGPWMDQDMKQGIWRKLRCLALHECTLGVVGVGAIGKAVLRRAQAFGMRLLGNDILEIDPSFVSFMGVAMQPLAEVLGQSDFVSLNCDLNPTSFHLINRESLAWSNPGLVLVNTARGRVVDQAAMIEALESGRLAGVALDVYEEEPLPAESPLRRMSNVLLAPHNANSSPSAWERVHRNTVKNLFLGLGLEAPRELREDS